MAGETQAGDDSPDPDEPSNESGLESWAKKFTPPPEDARILVAVVALELMVTWLYFAVTSSYITNPAYVLYPFIWINVGVYAAIKMKVSDVGTKYRVGAGVFAVFYFFVLMYLAGLINFRSMEMARVYDVSWASPGWGPNFSYADSNFSVSLVPFQVIGYASLAYLVYAALVDATKSVLTGVLGLVSCVGCTWPVVAALFTGVLGSGGSATALNSTVMQNSYTLSTVVFVVAVALLYFRPFS